LRKLGEGGMGVVYEAEQESPRRVVAVKVIQGGMFVDDARVRLFEREAEALARLRHPDIAVIYEAGRTREGLPFFAMELVKGDTLDTYMESRGPAASREEVRFRLALFRKIVDAVHYAHQRGVIHRDLKPSNILLTAEDSREVSGPDSTVQGLCLPAIKILDFGLAKITEGDISATTMNTGVGEIKGTLAYMSPEQARGDPEAIDVRTDVYALGVILYEMLAGQRPYDLARASLVEAVRVICEEPPRQLREAMRGSHRLDPDVETIVGKALEKESTRRYSSAAALSEDLTRQLTSQPIVARPPSTVYHLRKFAARNRVLVGGIAATFVALAAGATLATVLAVKEAAQRRVAEQARTDLEAVVSFQAGMLNTIDPEGVGRRLMADLERRVGQIRGSRGASERQIEAAKSKFAAAVEGVNPTNVALRMIDEEILGRAANTVDAQFEAQPLISARLRDTIGTTYDALGLYQPAEGQLKQSLDVRLSLLGEENPETLLSMKHLASLYFSEGRYPEARALAESSLAIHKRVLGERHRETLASAYYLAQVYARVDRFDEAEQLYKETLAAQKAVLGEGHPDTLATMNSLGMLFKDRGRLDLAESQLEATLELRRRVQGDENTDTLSTMNNLAIVYDYLGRTAEAAQLFSVSLAVKRRTLGEEHPDTLAVMNNLALEYSRLRRYAEAESLHLQVLAVRRRVLGEQHRDTLVSMNNLANLYADRGRFAEAEGLYRQTYEIRRRVLGAEHSDTLVSMNNLALLLYRDLRQYGEAERLLRTILDTRKRVLGFAHPDTERARANLIDVCRALGRTADVRQLAGEQLEARRIVAERPDATAGEINDYAWLLLTIEPATLQDPEEALRLAQRACAKEEQTSGPNLWNYLDTLALAWHRNGNTAEAVDTEAKALSLLPGTSPEREGLQRQLAEYEARLRADKRSKAAPPQAPAPRRHP